MKNDQLILKYICVNAENKNYIIKENMVSLKEFRQHIKFIKKLFKKLSGSGKMTQ